MALVAEWNTLEEWVVHFASVAPKDESGFDEKEVVVAVVGVESVALWAEVVGEVVMSSNCAIVCGVVPFVTLHAVEFDVAETDVSSFAVGAVRVGEQSFSEVFEVTTSSWMVS